MKFSRVFAMPNRWTFQIPPIRDFIERYLVGAKDVVDPFCGTSTLANWSNDITTGVDAVAYMETVYDKIRNKADAFLFDPPYSAEQLVRSYEEVRRHVTRADIQMIGRFTMVKMIATDILKPGGIALCFGWNSVGMGSDWPIEEILLVNHGAGHNDTICMAQRKPTDWLPFTG